MKEPALPCPGVRLTGLQVAAFSVKLKATSARILRNLELMLGCTTLRIRNKQPTYLPTTYPGVEPVPVPVPVSVPVPKLGLHAGLLSSNGSTLLGLTHTRGCCTCHVMD